jgi:hypothetical protein
MAAEGAFAVECSTGQEDDRHRPASFVASHPLGEFKAAIAGIGISRTASDISCSSSSASAPGAEVAVSTSSPGRSSTSFMVHRLSCSSSTKRVLIGADLLGLAAGWPQSLRTAVRIMLTTEHPMFLFWRRPRGSGCASGSRCAVAGAAVSPRCRATGHWYARFERLPGCSAVASKSVGTDDPLDRLDGMGSGRRPSPSHRGRLRSPSVQPVDPDQLTVLIGNGLQAPSFY